MTRPTTPHILSKNIILDRSLQIMPYTDAVKSRMVFRLTCWVQELDEINSLFFPENLLKTSLGPLHILFVLLCAMGFGKAIWHILKINCAQVIRAL